MKKIIGFLIVILVLGGITVNIFAQANNITTVFLVRHAEKVADGSNDPELTAAGKERAVELARVLSEADLDAVISTNYKRTRNTAEPSAKSKKLQTEIIPSLRTNDLKNYLDETLVKYKGGKILIVSHSNVVPLLIKLIRQEEPRDIKNLDDNAYDDLFVVSFTDRAKAEVLNLKYGKRSPVKNQ
ncbi:phosphoglycerate mutase family protein [candidate division KSB1 bacterium]